MKNSRTALNGRSAFSIVLKNGVSAVALGALAAALAMPAVAQEAPVEDSDVTEVVVTGQRAQLKSAQKIKRDADTVVDSITATDIGALPDRSVSEALQRVAGVTLERTDTNRDPARLSGEGGGVAIRGLNYVRTELNGRDVFSAKNGRSIGFADISADLMAGVDVFKNTTSDQVEGAIGGTVNLRTRLPFDSKKRIIAFSADSNYGDLRKDSFQSGSLTYSDRWDTSIGEIGLLLNGSLSNVGTRSDSVTTDSYITDSQGRSTPKGFGYKSLEWDQERTAIAGALQWRPNDQWEFTLQAIQAKATPKSMENTAYFDINTTPQSTYKYAGGTRGALTYAEGNDSPIFIARYGEDEKETNDVSLSFKFYPSDSLTLTGDLQYVKSQSKAMSLTVNTTYSASSDFKLDLSGDLPQMTIGQTAGYETAASYAYQSAMDHYEDSEADQFAARFDAVYEFDSDWLKKVKVGVRYTDKNSTTRETGWNWGAVSPGGNWGGDYNITNDGVNDYLADATPGKTGSGGQLSNVASYVKLDNFMHGNVDLDLPSAWFASKAFISNTRNAGDILHQASLNAWCGGCGYGFTPFNGDYEAVGQGRSDNNLSGINVQSETTKAFYTALYFGRDNAVGGKALDGNVGFRVVKTDVEGDLPYTTYPQITTPNVDPAASTAEKAEIARAKLFLNNTKVFGSTPSQNDYTDVLPSLNLRLHWSDELQFRFSASKAMVRPQLSDMQGYTSITANTTTFTVNAGNQAQYPGYAPGDYIASLNSITGIGGNPNLKPLTANQYDLTAEWYFAPTGSLTAAAFKKDLKNYFFGASQVESFTNNGVTLDVPVYRVHNGKSGEISGIELAYQQFYDFLPGALSGIGVQTNFTYIDSSGGANPISNVNDTNQVTNTAADLPLEGLSDKVFNFALMYEKYDISARLAYNWRSEYLMTTSAANSNMPVWMDAYGQLDASVFYQINSNLKIGLQGTNLTNDRITTKIGFPGQVANYSWVEQDRRLAIVLRGLF
ncbi:TonB-dependent receptor [Asticcacaulis machinosus]|uniref:TonB-dependent receptor n=1 Tax=Asticcacaulis machinosus TaxID=2984211 RepID=A0ABT5HI49_9CAUL|nr:TonB-dependent receptor [Asticcacaulis machinosus]MDC7675920.1 TonB-dependent receptor [Asticcacaulis machinosus]